MKIIRLLTVVLLAIVFYLPANPVMAESLPVLQAAPALALVPADGSWTGTTDLGKSMSFIAQSNGTQWSTFVLTTAWSNGGCSVTLTTTCRDQVPFQTVNSVGPAYILLLQVRSHPNLPRLEPTRIQINLPDVAPSVNSGHGQLPYRFHFQLHLGRALL